MALFQINDAQDTEYWAAYLTQRSNDANALNGLVVNDPELLRLLNLGERVWNFPYRDALNAQNEDYPDDSENTNTPDGMTTDNIKAVRLDRARSWKSSVIAQEIKRVGSIAEFMAGVGDYLETRKRVNIQAVLRGVKSRNATVPSTTSVHKRNDLIFDKVKEADADNRGVSINDFVDMNTEFSGYRNSADGIRGVWVCNPVQAGAARKLDLTSGSLQPPSERFPFGVIYGWVIVEDVNMPTGRFNSTNDTQLAAAPTGSENFSSVFIRGAGIVHAQAAIDLATYTNYAQGNGGWTETLHMKTKYCIHVPGVTYAGSETANPKIASGTGGALEANDLDNPTSWNFRDTKDRIGVRFLDTQEKVRS